MEQGWVGNEKMQSIFGAVRLLGGSISVAYIAQTATAVIVASLLIYLCAVVPMWDGVGAAIATASLLATPFLLPYDLTILAVPLVFIIKASHKTGFLPWEKSALMAAFVLPLFSTTVASYLRIPISPLIIAGLYVVLIRRIPCIRIMPIRA
jgi:succinate dehydrogenase hydrophobic anchor subunit